MRVLIPLLLAAATPALAESQRDAFTCEVLQTCVLEESCTDSGPLFGLAFLGGGLEIEMGGTWFAVAYDGILRTAAWGHEGQVYQLHITGDATGVLLRSPESGSVGGSALMTFQCSPA